MRLVSECRATLPPGVNMQVMKDYLSTWLEYTSENSKERKGLPPRTNAEVTREDHRG